MTKFHHPYQFIPATGKINEIRTRHDFQDIKKGISDTYARHDLWLKGSRSGKIICRVHLESPTIVGAEQEQGSDNEPGVVRQYKRFGKPALPASSLRGMVASIAETLSQSSLRVLEEKAYSVRKLVDGALKSVGELTRKNGEWFVREMSLASIPSDMAKDLFNRAQNEHGTKGRPRFFAKCLNGEISGHPITEKDWRDLNTPEVYVEGCLRILDAPREQVPKNRENDLFVYPAATEIQLRKVPEKVIATFEQLIAEREEASRKQSVKLPFPIMGEENWKIREGLTVYFRLEKGVVERRVVAEISPSAIWRSPIASTSYDFFHAIDADLLPWGHPSRTGLTAAELLFGVVSEEENPEESGNLASRVRFGDALPSPNKEVARLGCVTLKILASPKPPSPAMYFHPAGKRGTWAAKADLSQGRHHPNGRKVYLHYPPAALGDEPWRSRHPSENRKQKLTCRPMSKGEGQNFYFTVDFENLSDAELTLLMTALAPSEGFRHRLGLGKPLGLGSVKVGIEGLFLIDRNARYGADALAQPRCSQILKGEEHHLEDWADLFPLESEAWSKAEVFDRQKIHDTLLLDRETLKALLATGNPEGLQEGIKVMPPMLMSQHDSEQETFKWFVENDKNFKYALGPVLVGHKLPALSRNERPVPPPPEWTGPVEIEDDPAEEWLNVRIDALKQGKAPMHIQQALYGRLLANAWRDELADDPMLQRAVRKLICRRWGKEKWNDPGKGAAKKAREIYGEE